MPDDDRFSRDHGPGWKNVIDLYSRRKHAPPEGDLPPPSHRNLDGADQAFASAMCQTLARIQPQPRSEDFRDAAATAQRIARKVLRGNDDELCTSSSDFGTALLSQATRVVVARDGADTTLTRSSDDLVEQIAREFLKGLGRRYGLDRAAMQNSGVAFENALELLAGLDNFLAGPAAGALVRYLLKKLDADRAANTSEVA